MANGGDPSPPPPPSPPPLLRRQRSSGSGRGGDWTAWCGWYSTPIPCPRPPLVRAPPPWSSSSSSSSICARKWVAFTRWRILGAKVGGGRGAAPCIGAAIEAPRYDGCARSAWSHRTRPVHRTIAGPSWGSVREGHERGPRDGEETEVFEHAARRFLESCVLVGVAKLRQLLATPGPRQGARRQPTKVYV